MPETADPLTANEGRTHTHEGNCFRTHNVVPDVMPFDETQITDPRNRSAPKSGEPCHAMSRRMRPPAVVIRHTAFDTYNQSLSDVSQTLRNPNGTNGDAIPAVFSVEEVDDAAGEATIVSVEHALHTQGKIIARDYSEPITASERKGHSIVIETQIVDVYNQTVRDDGATHTLCSRGDNNGGVGHLVPVVAIRESGKGYWLPTEVAGAIDAHVGQSGTGAMRPAVVFGGTNDARAICEGAHGVTELDVATTLAQGGGKPGQGYQAARIDVTVRRLTPRECERLQGFPDDWTLIPVRGKPAADGSRYKSVGNSMAVNVMRWIGDRIATVDAAQPADPHT